MKIGGLKPARTLRNPGAVGFYGDDVYGRAPFSQALADLIDGADPGGPVVLGVCGRFGSGKSSVLAMLEHILRLRGRHRVLWISSWRLNGPEQLLASMLHMIALSIRADWAGTWLYVLLARAKRIGFPTWFAFLFPLSLWAAFKVASPENIGQVKEIIAGDTAKLALPIAVSTALAILIQAAKPLVSSIGKLLPQSPSERIGALSQFADEMDIYACVLRSRGRFVVLVEDLDRCSPSRILEMLNAIGQIIAHPNARRFCFVVAFDYTIVRDRLAEALKHPEEDIKIATGRAAEHLQKIMALCLNLPPVNLEFKRAPSGVLRKFLGNLVGRRVPVIDALAVSSVLSFLLLWGYSKFESVPPYWSVPLVLLGLAGIFRLIQWFFRDKRTSKPIGEIEASIMEDFKGLLTDNLREQVVAENHALAVIRLWDVYRNKRDLDAWQAFSTSAFLMRFAHIARPENLKAPSMTYLEGGDEFIKAGSRSGRSLEHCRDAELIRGYHNIFANLSDFQPVPLRLRP